VTGDVTGDAARVARATLLRISEPGTALVHHVRRHGPETTVADVRAGAAIPGVDVAALQARLTEADGRADLDRAAAVGARLVCPGDPEWPALLDDLARVDADCFGLWARGPLALAEACGRAVAIVGTRTATAYGEHVTAELACGLGDRGWTIVSGLAYGIDGAAHRAALAAEAPTVAVLACGVDVPYPHGHRSLYERVAGAGLVVSEHPPGAAPQRHRFLVRNRIIAALSLGTVMVEAAVRSGARSTLNHARDLLRHTMVVPGPVTNAMSAGCHVALREVVGSVLVTRAAEVIEQCGHLGELADPLSPPPRPRDALGPLVRRVFDAVPVVKPVPAPRIALTAGVRLEAVEPALAALRTLGLVERDEAGWRMSRAGRDERRAERRPDSPLPLAWL
jgi:DNA processing protein